jgi:type IV pilus assembly protein PilC
MHYRVVIRKEGQPDTTRTVEAESRFQVYEDIHNEGAYVVTITEKGSGFDISKVFNMTIGTGVKTEERIAFTKNLSAMLSAGLTLSRALSVIERQTHNRALKRIVTDIEAQVRKGNTLHEALARYPKVFSHLFIAMTKSGEESGTIADSLKVVARQMDRSYTLTKKIRGAMIYPCIILSAIVVIGVLMLMYVVPTLSSTFKSLGVALPLATRIIVTGSDFMSHNVIIVFIALALFFGSIITFVKSRIGAKIILTVSMRLPVIGELVRETFGARAARSLASLLSSGVEMLSAIEITGEVVGENVFGSVLVEASARVKKGEQLSAAFADHSNLYPFFIADMISVGEETGKVAEMLSQAAEYYENDVEEKTKDLSTIIEPMLMLVIGVAVGIFALAMIAPIYSLSSKI